LCVGNPNSTFSTSNFIVTTPPIGTGTELEAKNNNIKQEKQVKTSVNTKQVIKKIMAIKSINDIQQDKMSEIQASDVRELFRDGVKDAVDSANTDWENKVNAEKDAKAAIEKTKSDLEAALQNQKEEFEKVQADFDKVNKELDSLKEAQILAEQERNFQERMSLIDEEYNLDKKARETLAKTIKKIGDDADFNEWKQSFDTVANLKKKGASPEASATESLASVSTEISKTGVPNTVSEELKSEDSMSKLRDAFSVEKGGVSIANRLF
jgi:hypothetical protein